MHSTSRPLQVTACLHWIAVIVGPPLLVDVLVRLRLSLALFFIEQCYKDRQNQVPDYTKTCTRLNLYMTVPYESIR